MNFLTLPLKCDKNLIMCILKAINKQIEKLIENS